MRTPCSSLQRPTYSYPLKVDTDISMVEDALLQSPLITASGNVVLVGDDMTVWVMPDPASVVANGAAWAPLATFPASAYAPLPTADPTDLVHAGSYLDTDGTLYVLDGRNHALRALTVSATSITEKTPASPLYFNHSRYIFSISGTASLTMVADSTNGNQLWIPISGTPEGADGIAYVVPACMFNGCAFTPFVVPLPTGCRYPSDLGSATITARNTQTGATEPAVVTLGSATCNLQVNSANLMTAAVENVWAPPSSGWRS
jgi:hypothetical protein